MGVNNDDKAIEFIFFKFPSLMVLIGNENVSLFLHTWMGSNLPFKGMFSSIFLYL